MSLGHEDNHDGAVLTLRRIFRFALRLAGVKAGMDWR